MYAPEESLDVRVQELEFEGLQALQRGSLQSGLLGAEALRHSNLHILGPAHSHKDARQRDKLGTPACTNASSCLRLVRQIGHDKKDDQIHPFMCVCVALLMYL